MEPQNWGSLSAFAAMSLASGGDILSEWSYFDGLLQREGRDIVKKLMSFKQCCDAEWCDEPFESFVKSLEAPCEEIMRLEKTLSVYWAEVKVFSALARKEF